MIIESLALSFSVIFASSLWFLDKKSKRDNASVKKVVNTDNKAEVVINPFIHFNLGTECPKCKVKCKNAVMKKHTNGYEYVVDKEQGPALPVSCSLKDCVASNLSHLHVYCFSCKSRWLMATADYVEKSKPKTDLELFDALINQLPSARG